MVSANFPICFSSVGTTWSAGRGRRAHRHISMWEAYGLKGQESIAQASAGLQPGFIIYNETALKGRQKSCYPATPIPSLAALTLAIGVRRQCEPSSNRRCSAKSNSTVDNQLGADDVA